MAKARKPTRLAAPPAKPAASDRARLKRLLKEQAELIDAPVDDTMTQRQKLADIRSRIYSVQARLAKKSGEKVAYERIANEAGTEARQAAKASHIDRIMLLLRTRDEEQAIATAFATLAKRRR